MADLRAPPGPSATLHCWTCDDTRVTPQGVDVDACPVCARLAEAAYQNSLEPSRASFHFLDAVAQNRTEAVMRRTTISAPSKNRLNAA
jgi:hypothetical protein